MSNLEAKKIAPATGTTVTLGAAGDAVTVAASALKTNTIKDAGGNTIFTSDGSGTLSSVNSALKGGLNFISSQTASGSATLSFTSGIDSTYKEYIFFFNAINSATDNVNFEFQGNVSGQSGYNETMTTTLFRAQHNEADTDAEVGYVRSQDQAQGTAFQLLGGGLGNGADECLAGELHLFNPSSTTNIKNFFHRGVVYGESDFAQDDYIAGYFNVTAAITQIQFKMSSGNIDAGIIQMYGVL